ncbi:hypothetical protein CYQ75_11150 [Enterococcus faecium]|nr:hypothetical protein CYQ75_11150 [Enterococcus faecium]
MSLKTLYRKRTVIWPFYFYTIIRTLSRKNFLSCLKIKEPNFYYENIKKKKLSFRDNPRS